MAAVMQNRDINHIWDQLRGGFEQVFQRRSMSKAQYIELYTHEYNYLSKVDLNGNTRGQSFNGFELYNRIEEFLKDYQAVLLDNGACLTDEDVLKFSTGPAPTSTGPGSGRR